LQHELLVYTQYCEGN